MALVTAGILAHAMTYYSAITEIVSALHVWVITVYGLVMVNEGLVEWLGLGEVCMRSNRSHIGLKVHGEGPGQGHHARLSWLQGRFRGLPVTSLLLPPLHGVGRLLPASCSHCRMLYKMMTLEDVRSEVVRILPAHAAELKEASHARCCVRHHGVALGVIRVVW